MTNNHKDACSLCGSTDKTLVRIENSMFCADCLRSLSDNIKKRDCDNELSRKKIDAENREIPKPSKIIKILDQYVIGQDDAKKILSTAVYNHLKSLKYKDIYGNKPPVEIEKSNIIMLGPTGSGKTHILRTLAKTFDLPFAIQDCTSLTAAGYVGEDVENCLRKLINAADGDVKKAERGIVFLDEVDKIGRKGENPSISRDVSGEGVQQALLKLIEGTVASVPPQGGRKHPDQKNIDIDTTNILFVCGGAFEGIEKIIAKRINGKNSMGFGANVNNLNKLDFNDYIHKASTEDLKQFGMMPEFLGRFPVICTLSELTEKELVRILNEPKNALFKQYKALFSIDDVDLDFTDDAAIKIAKNAIKNKTGARGLRSIIENLLLDTMVEVPDLDINNVLVDIKNDDFFIEKSLVEKTEIKGNKVV